MCKALYQPQLVGMLLIPKFRYVEPYLDKHADEVMMLVMILAECMNGVHKASVNILVVTLALLMCPRFNIRSTLENDTVFEKFAWTISRIIPKILQIRVESRRSLAGRCAPAQPLVTLVSGLRRHFRQPTAQTRITTRWQGCLDIKSKSCVQIYKTHFALTRTVARASLR